MDYALAKELKDAGFPQYGQSYFTTEDDNTRLHSLGQKYKFGSLSTDKEVVYFPTLDELIDACGDDFNSLTYSGSVNNLWWVYQRNNDFSTQGHSRVEAVGRLWMALSKK
jgi:hypothetical protein